MASRAFGDALLVAGLKTATSLAVLATGFRALSDDDFARIVIAERFAHAPSFDPSGTSWLPFPFWVSGGVMALTERSVCSARVTAFALGVAAALLCWLAARWLGAGRMAAVVGAVLGSGFPYAAWLGVVATPEAFTAALVVLGIASLSRSELLLRSCGALCLALSCVSRYEPWPVALVFAVYTSFDAVRHRRPALLGAAALSVSGATAWLIHGVIRHHDAFFFVQRVAAYRRAVGGGEHSTLAAAFRYPSMLFRCEPEVAALAIVGVVGLVALGNRAVFARHCRAAVAVVALLGFLIAGELRDGAPTHHAERALLAIWVVASLFAADAAAELWREPRHRTKLVASALALVGLAIFIVRPWYARRDSFIDRSPEIAVGVIARQNAEADTRLLVDHPDFGFYAVIAGFGAPERAAPIDDHDPRTPRVDLSSREALAAAVERERATLVVLQRAHWPLLDGETLAERGELRLLRVR